MQRETAGKTELRPRFGSDVQLVWGTIGCMWGESKYEVPYVESTEQLTMLVQKSAKCLLFKSYSLLRTLMKEEEKRLTVCTKHKGR